MKKRLQILMAAIIISQSFAAETIIFKGSNYPNEDTFSRELKSKYDLIEKKWTFPNQQTMLLETYYLGPKDKIESTEFKFQETFNENFLNKKNIAYINWGIPTAFALYGILFWDWGKIKKFKTRDEGWFEKNTYAGGADKLAHMYSHFLLTRASYSFYRNNGLSRDESLFHSTLLASSVGVLIEVGDGLSHYGFAINDIISDFVGVGFGYLLNRYAYLDELIGLQFYWWNNSKDPEHKGQKFNDPIDDYNNQKYILNFRFAAIPVLRDFVGTRYINFDIGGYSRGYKDSSSDDLTRRVLYTGFSLNLTQVLRDLFPKSDYSYHTANFLKYYQPPLTGFEALSGIDRD
jgi:hypothetical protein